MVESLTKILGEKLWQHLYLYHCYKNIWSIELSCSSLVLNWEIHRDITIALLAADSHPSPIWPQRTIRELSSHFHNHFPYFCYCTLVSTFQCFPPAFNYYGYRIYWSKSKYVQFFKPINVYINMPFQRHTLCLWTRRCHLEQTYIHHHIYMSY